MWKALLLIVLLFAGCAHEGRSPEGNPIIELAGDWRPGELICYRDRWWRIKKVSANVQQQSCGGGGGPLGPSPTRYYTRYVELVPDTEE